MGFAKMGDLVQKIYEQVYKNGIKHCQLWSTHTLEGIMSIATKKSKTRCPKQLHNLL
jgi:hypothetical protein